MKYFRVAFPQVRELALSGASGPRATPGLAFGRPVRKLGTAGLGKTEMSSPRG